MGAAGTGARYLERSGNRLVVGGGQPGGLVIEVSLRHSLSPLLLD